MIIAYGYLDQYKQIDLNTYPSWFVNIDTKASPKRYKYNKYFETSARPFVVKTYGITGCIDLNGNVVDCPEATVTTQSILDYNGDINIYDLAALVKQWEF